LNLGKKDSLNLEKKLKEDLKTCYDPTGWDLSKECCNKCYFVSGEIVVATIQKRKLQETYY
jgi:hypothetical protein